LSTTTAISIRRQLSPDLVQNVNWPLFSGRPDLKNRYPSVAAYTLTWSIGGDGDTFRREAARDLELRLVRAAEGLSCALQIFVAHPTMQPRAATVLYRKIWKSLSIGVVPASAELGFENLIECVPGVRFASLANVPMVAIPWMISILQRFDVVVPLLFKLPFNIQDSSALELARIAFPPNGCSTHSNLDWAAFSCHVAMLDGFCVRYPGNIEAGELSVDFFASEANMPALVRILERDDRLNTYRVQ
jgi:hypothetical protein